MKFTPKLLFFALRSSIYVSLKGILEIIAKIQLFMHNTDIQNSSLQEQYQLNQSSFTSHNNLVKLQMKIKTENSFKKGAHPFITGLQITMTS